MQGLQATRFEQLAGGAVSIIKLLELGLREGLHVGGKGSQALRLGMIEVAY